VAAWGLEIARHLIATGNKVVATARDPDRIAAQFRL
jgi:NADP-dependent 3-hydroxy acid dehydrogenase YdfG